MAIVSIYDLDGKEHKRETVDARELEALGWTREPKPVAEPEKEPMTSAQLREALTAAGVEFKSNASKAELQALFDGVGAE